jgi:hypothetical protein
MDTTIAVIWWIGLIGALILTLIAIKLILLIVQTEREILQLAQTTLPAARGIATNTALVSQLETTNGVAGRILTVVRALESGSASIQEKLRALGRTLAQRRI